MTNAITANTNLIELARDFYQRVRDTQSEAGKKSLFEGYLQNLNGNHQVLAKMAGNTPKKSAKKPYNVGTLLTQLRNWQSKELKEIDRVLWRMFEEK